jgi:hypothetical protein
MVGTVNPLKGTLQAEEELRSQDVTVETLGDLGGWL